MLKTSRMEAIESEIKRNIDKIFPFGQVQVLTPMTGSALLFLKGTKYLVKKT